MNLLAIDTTTEIATVALSYKQQMYHAKNTHIREHAKYILPMIDNLLEQASCQISQLDGIVFGCGPGSFTGLRIACSVAKGLAYAQDLPIFPVSSLQVIAHAVFAKGDNTPVLALLDARMHELYWQYFTNLSDFNEQRVSAVSDIILLNDKPIVVAGFAYDSYWEELDENIKSRVVKQYQIYPEARIMIELVAQGHIQSVGADIAEPTYVRNKVTHGEKGG